MSMARIMDQITLGDLKITVFDVSPVGSGITVETGSLALAADGSGFYQHTGSDWVLSSVDAVQLGLDLDAIRTRVSSLEDDVVKKTYVDSADSALQGQITQEISDRQAADASTLAEAKGYTDQQVSSLINSAPGVLDTLKELADAIGDDPNFATTVASQVNAVQSNLEAEISDRQSADQNLDSRITTLEQSTQGGLSQEISDRQAADTALGQRIDQEISDREADVNAEETRALAAELVLDNKINSEISDRQSAISTEAATRLSEDQALGGRIDQEISDRQDAVSNEQSARQLADTALGGRIDQEVSDRQSADIALGGRIDQEISDRQDAVSSEAATRLAADNVLSGRLNSLELDSVTKSYVDQKDGETLSSAETYADQKVADLVNSAPQILDTLKELADALGSDPNFATTVANQIGQVQTNLDQEVSDRQSEVSTEAATRLSADNALGSRIDQEINDRQSAVSSEASARQSADSSLQTALNTEISDRQSADALKVDKAGDTMSGALNMGNNDVKNVSKVGVGTASPGTVLEIVDNNVKYNMSGYETTTVGAVTSTMGTISPAVDSVELVKVLVTGLDNSGSSVSYERTARIKNIGGTVSLGTVQSDYTSEDAGLGAANCTFIVDGSDVKVEVSGVIGKTMTWKCMLQRVR